MPHAPAAHALAPAALLQAVLRQPQLLQQAVARAQRPRALLQLLQVRQARVHAAHLAQAQRVQQLQRQQHARAVHRVVQRQPELIHLRRLDARVRHAHARASLRPHVAAQQAEGGIRRHGLQLFSRQLGVRNRPDFHHEANLGGNEMLLSGQILAHFRQNGNGVGAGHSGQNSRQ